MKTRGDRQTVRDSLGLITQAQAGDGAAFEAIYNLHKRKVYNVCFFMTTNVADAEDLTQEAFLQVFRKISTFRGEAAFSTWLYRVAVNTVFMKLRRRKCPHTVSLDDESLDNENASHIQRKLGKRDSDLDGALDRKDLKRAIAKLPRGYRNKFMLHEIEGYEHSEIAAMVGCSIGNSKSQLHKAKMKLREMLAGRQQYAQGTHCALRA